MKTQPNKKQSKDARRKAQAQAAIDVRQVADARAGGSAIARASFMQARSAKFGGDTRQRNVRSRRDGRKECQSF